MAELLVVGNPRRRRKRRARRRNPNGWAMRYAGPQESIYDKAGPKPLRKRRRRRRARVRRRRARGRRRMTALQRRYFGPRRHRRRHARRRHHVRRRHHRRARRMHRFPRGARPARGYVIGRRRIRRRKLNPFRLGGITGRVMPTVRAGAWGAAGALGLDALWGLVYPRLGTFSSYLDNPYIGFAAKAVGAVTVGMVGSNIPGVRGRGPQLAVGAMTVVTHDFLKTLLQQMMPGMFGPGGTLPLGAYVGSFLSGSAPIVGTATVPQAYLPYSGIGSTGVNESYYTDDRLGENPWDDQLHQSDW